MECDHLLTALVKLETKIFTRPIQTRGEGKETEDYEWQ